MMSHLDTVHPVGTLKTLPFRRDGWRCYGPGILDMKGGAYAGLQAIIALAKAGIETPLPVSVLFHERRGDRQPRYARPDHGAGASASLHPRSRTGRPGNGVVTGRYAIARFNLLAEGRPSHAGSQLKNGRSAISMMAQQLLAIEAMTMTTAPSASA